MSPTCVAAAALAARVALHTENGRGFCEAVWKRVPTGDEDHSLGDVDASFVVARRMPPARHEDEGPLIHRPAEEDCEALVIVGASDSLDEEVEIGGFVRQLEPFIGCVGEQVLQPGPALADGVQNWLCASAMADFGRVQVYQQQPHVGVDREGALA